MCEVEPSVFPPKKSFPDNKTRIASYWSSFQLTHETAIRDQRSSSRRLSSHFYPKHPSHTWRVRSRNTSPLREAAECHLVGRARCTTITVFCEHLTPGSSLQWSNSREEERKHGGLQSPLKARLGPILFLTHSWSTPKHVSPCAAVKVHGVNSEAWAHEPKRLWCFGSVTSESRDINQIQHYHML